MDLFKWLGFNLNDHVWIPSMRVSWTCLFELIIWRIWKIRIFSFFKVWIKILLRLLKPLLVVQNNMLWSIRRLLLGSMKSVSIYPMQKSCVSYILMGVLKQGVWLSFAGEVLRDQNGEWILGYNDYLGECSLFDAELLRILDGLIPCQKQGLEIVVIHTDSLDVIIAILDRNFIGTNSTLVKWISQVLHGFGK